MKKPLRIAVIGTGHWGQRIIATLQSLPQCTVVATATRDYAALVDHTKIDGVVIATPAKTHAIIAETCLSAGIPVFVEKPFTTSVVDAERLVAIAQEHRASIFVGHIDLFNDAYRTMKAKLPTIGQLREICVEMGSQGGGRDDVSALWDWSPHSVAVVCDIMGEFPATISAMGDPAAFPTSVTLDCTFANGAAAHIENSWHFPEKRRRVTVIGDRGSVTYDDIRDKKIMPPLTAEMTAWLAALADGTPIDTTLAVDVVRILETAEQAMTHG